MLQSEQNDPDTFVFSLFILISCSRSCCYALIPRHDLVVHYCLLKIEHKMNDNTYNRRRIQKAKKTKQTKKITVTLLVFAKHFCKIMCHLD